MCCSPWGRKESDTTEQLNSLNKVHEEIDGFTGEFYQTFRDELSPSFRNYSKLFLQRKEHLQTNSFYEATITLMPKPRRACAHTHKLLK